MNLIAQTDKMKDFSKKSSIDALRDLQNSSKTNVANPSTAKGDTTLNFGQEAQTAGIPGSGSTFGEFVGGALSGIMMFAAVLTLLYLIWGGIHWITSGGDKSKVESARNKISHAILGLVVLGATTAVFMLLQNFLGICVLDLGGGC